MCVTVFTNSSPTPASTCYSTRISHANTCPLSFLMGLIDDRGGWYVENRDLALRLAISKPDFRFFNAAAARRPYITHSVELLGSLSEVNAAVTGIEDVLAAARVGNNNETTAPTHLEMKQAYVCHISKHRLYLSLDHSCRESPDVWPTSDSAKRRTWSSHPKPPLSFPFVLFPMLTPNNGSPCASLRFVR